MEEYNLICRSLRNKKSIFIFPKVSDIINEVDLFLLMSLRQKRLTKALFLPLKALKSAF